MAKDEAVSMGTDDDDTPLPDKAAAKEFYAKYEPKEVLGRGISSVVRRVVEKETGHQFATKIIDLGNDPDDPEGEGMREATKREIQVLRLVAGHTYIVELHDVFESPSFIFLVFELCIEGELFDYLTDVVTLSEKKTKKFMYQIFQALQAIHKKGVVHRDLKPENILLDDNMNIKVTDFGFAKVLQPEEKLYDTCGTPGYLAPELLRCAMFEDAEGYGKEVDMWSCGVIMYTLLVGCPPFWHRKQMIMIRNIMEGKYELTLPEWSDITDPPKDLIRQLLTVDPSKRLTVEKALQHHFFHRLDSAGSTSVSPQDEVKPFEPLKRFRTAAVCVRALIRLRRIRQTQLPLSVESARTDPYHIKKLRKVIDNCAFRVYGHWVKKQAGQNRAALFENRPKTEAKLVYLSTLNS